MLHIVINPKFEPQLGDFIRSVPDIFSHEGATIYKARNEIKVIERDGMLLNVKQYAIANVINRVVYRFFRKPKAERAYIYALKLLELGVPTPEPVGYLLDKAPGHLRHSYLITRQSPLSRNMYEFGKGGIKGREDIIEAFAQFSAEIHQKGVYHLDYSPGNILFDRNQESGTWDFTLVDINRMQFKEVSMRERCRNFQRLWGGDDFIQLLAHHYAQASGYDESEVQSLIAHYHHAFWDKRR